MPQVIVHHEVKNYDSWKKAFDLGEAARKTKGINHMHSGRHLNDPNHVYMVFNVDDVDTLHNHLSHNDTKSFLELGGGIVGENHVIVLS